MEEALPPRRMGWAKRVALVAVALVVVPVAVLWLARLPLATRFVDRELARAGVPARYTLAGLGPHGQRLENVVLGDPAHPDLVADWIETETGIGLSGPYLDGVRAGHVRINARLVGGRVSLGSLDRLLPPPSGKPFALPALRVEGEDVRLRLSTAAGTVGLKLAGKGRLDDGFRGTLAAVAPRLVLGGCVATGVRAAVRLAIDDAAPAVRGPVRAARVGCGPAGGRAIGLDVDAILAPALDRWRGRVRVATGALAVAGPAAASAAGMSGTVAFAGDAGYTSGRVDLAAAGVATASATARSVAVGAPLALDGAGFSLGESDHATVRVAGMRLAEPLLRRADVLRAGGGAHPVAPLLAHLAGSVRRAGTDFDVTATGGLVVGADGGEASLASAELVAASGAGVRWRGTAASRWGDDAAVVLEGRLSTGGGGLPTVAVDLRRAASGAIAGTAAVAPYQAGGARLGLAPVRFVAGGDGISIDTVATLAGPLGDGRVDGLRVPVRARLAGGVLLAGSGCTPVSAAALRVAGLALDRPALTLCATGPALVRIAGGGVSGGARLPELRLRGTLGASPLAIDGEGARIDLADGGFAVEGLRTRLGAPDRETALNFASLAGRISAGGVGGSFAGGTGRIAAVPLIVGEAAGDWRFAGGALAVAGAMVVTDADAAPRFRPLRAQGVRLRLAGNAIHAGATLVEPTTATAVATVAIDHALGSGVGHADLDVPGITFGEGFQPDLLTRLTFGVIAAVEGKVAGGGRIDWGPGGVTSTGRFRTDRIDLAAAFGPVTGLAGEVVFDDLLGLATPPGQVATVKEINPGIAVNDGVVRYRLLPGTRIAVEGARWPFAGGTLTLDPTTLDFGQDVARAMTFRVAGAAADKFLQQFAFDNLQATGTFDGVLPMVFDQTGGRIERGALTVRDGGGTIAYVGELTRKDLGFWGDLAFRSLRSLRYRSLDVRLNGPLAGEMVTEVKFAGISQGEGATSNFIVRRLQRLPFVFNIRIQAPFRGLLDSVQSFYDPRRLIGRNLPALLDAQKRAADKPAGAPVQPPASEKRP